MNQPRSSASFKNVFEAIKTIKGFLYDLKGITIFLPGLIAIFVLYEIFWNVEQAKDLLIANTSHYSSFFLYFFTSFCLFVMVIWYSTELVLRVYRNAKQIDLPAYYNYIPRVMGFSCFSIMWSSILQFYYLREFAISKGWAQFFILASVILYISLIGVLKKFLYHKIILGRLINIIVYLLGIGFMVFTYSLHSLESRLKGFFYAIVVAQVAYVFLVEYSRIRSEKVPNYEDRRPILRLISFFMLDVKDANFFLFFNLYSLTILLFYLFCVIDVSFIFHVGSLFFLFSAFSVFIGFANFITAFSVRQKANIGLLLLLFIVISSKLLHNGSDVYQVRMQDASHQDYHKREGLRSYYHHWLQQRQAEIDTSSEGFPVYFVLSDGGASRSAYWVASVLSKLQETTHKDFSNHLFCLSGASGGSLGNAVFYSLLHFDKEHGDTINNYLARSQQFLEHDFLSFTLSRMLGGDLLNYLSPQIHLDDRSIALEKSMEYFKDDSISHLFSQQFSQYTFSPWRYKLPILCINVTRMQDGNPAVISTVNIDSTKDIFNGRVDMLDLLDTNKDINLSTAVVLGARFPYVNPAGNIKDQYFVDGGYFDNSGSGIVEEIVNVLQVYGHDQEIYPLASKLKFYIIHITNSPEAEFEFKRISPLANDLTAPLQTLLSAYNSQTSIMDKRLYQYMQDLYPEKDTVDHYYLVPLYKGKDELKSTDPYYDKRIQKEVPYSMNWYISDTTRHRMDARLQNNPSLDYLIAQMKGHFK